MPAHTVKRSIRSNFVLESHHFVQEPITFMEPNNNYTTFAATKLKNNNDMNEETLIEKRPVVNGQSESKQEGNAWKQVTLGGVSGILMGAGLLYAGQAVAKESNPEKNTPEVVAPEVDEVSHILENGLKVAAVNDDLSFGQAFAAARAEVGPGGVFHWHGGIYNTYTAAEWNAMSISQKHDFAQLVQPEIRPSELSTPTDANTHVVVIHHVYHHRDNSSSENMHQTEAATDDVQVVERQIAENFDMGDDVHIVGYANAEGHLVVGYDTTGDGQADVAIIDMDNNFQPSDTDVIMDREGNMARLGELGNEPNPNILTDQENPDFFIDNSDDAMMVDA